VTHSCRSVKLDGLASIFLHCAEEDFQDGETRINSGCVQLYR
jgi:hypothetical protein